MCSHNNNLRHNPIFLPFLYSVILSSSAAHAGLVLSFSFLSLFSSIPLLGFSSFLLPPFPVSFCSLYFTSSFPVLFCRPFFSFPISPLLFSYSSRFFIFTPYILLFNSSFPSFLPFLPSLLSLLLIFLFPFSLQIYFYFPPSSSSFPFLPSFPFLSPFSYFPFPFPLFSLSFSRFSLFSSSFPFLYSLSFLLSSPFIFPVNF